MPALTPAEGREATDPLADGFTGWSPETAAEADDLTLPNADSAARIHEQRHRADQHQEPAE